MKSAVFFSMLFIYVMTTTVFSQVAVPRESQRQEIVQTIGDARVSIIYHRPNVKGRKIWDGLVSYGKVWRAGANEATIFEVTRDVTVNGKPLPAGKYSVHMIPTASDWTIIFNTRWDQPGSAEYDEKLDALRVTSKPVASEFFETLVYGFGETKPNSAIVFLRWEKLRVPFTVDTGDIYGRVLTQLRDAIKNRKPDDARPLNQAVAYVYTFRLKENYGEAIGWVDASITLGETFANLSQKARILKEQGKTSEAIALAEKAIAVGKASIPPANINGINALQDTINEWKTNK
ncbi:MAG: DUF2911 domain-containing protein [Blastocatellia bacterium]